MEDLFTAACRARTNAIAADTLSREGGVFFCSNVCIVAVLWEAASNGEGDGMRFDADAAWTVLFGLFTTVGSSLLETAGMVETTIA